MSETVDKIKKVKKAKAVKVKVAVEPAVATEPVNPNIEIISQEDLDRMPNLVAKPEDGTAGLMDLGEVVKVDYSEVFNQGLEALMAVKDEGSVEVDFPQTSFEYCVKDFGSLESESFHEAMDYLSQQLHRRLLQVGQKTAIDVAALINHVSQAKPYIVPGVFVFI